MKKEEYILDNLVSGIVAIDPEEKVTVFNRAAERILKFSADKALGQDVRKLSARLANILLDTLHKGKRYHREELSVSSGNSLIGVSTSRFYDGQSKLLGACMVFSSLTEIKKKEQVVRRENLDRYWSNVANSLAHEVKNSIMATKAFTEMLPEKYEDAQFRRNLYSTLKRDIEKLDKFSEELLNFVQEPQLVIQSCRINQVVDAAIDFVLQDKKLGKITLEKKYELNLKPLPGDYHQLKQAFVQLINNALEAMAGNGKLTVSIIAQNSSSEGSEVIVVKISDTGCGILPAYLPRLFDPFFTTKVGRSGLGLAGAQKVVESHGGTINVESKPEAGSTFRIYLPIPREESGEENGERD